MGLFKEHATLGQCIYVWCLGLRMAAEAAHPVIQVIDGDEQDIGVLGPLAVDAQGKESAEGKHPGLWCGHSHESIQFPTHAVSLIASLIGRRVPGEPWLLRVGSFECPPC